MITLERFADGSAYCVGAFYPGMHEGLAHGMRAPDEMRRIHNGPHRDADDDLLDLALRKMQRMCDVAHELASPARPSA